MLGWRELLTASPAAARVQMTSPGTVLAIPAAAFGDIAATQPSMARELYQELSDELAAAEASLEVYLLLL